MAGSNWPDDRNVGLDLAIAALMYFQRFIDSFLGNDLTIIFGNYEDSNGDSDIFIAYNNWYEKPK